MLITPSPKEVQVLSHFLSNPDTSRGWAFNSGDPEWWKYSKILVKPNAWVLDLGGGLGRSSMFFALHAMNVDLYDLDKERVETLKDSLVGTNLPINVMHADVNCVELPINAYHIAMMSQLFIHFPSKAKAFDVIAKAYEAVAPGGYIWIRAVGKSDETYQYRHTFDSTIIDGDVHLALCGCSGELKDEYHLYFGQTELLEFLCCLGMKIILHRCLPELGVINYMYGEDWFCSDEFLKSYGAITILAQKAC